MPDSSFIAADAAIGVGHIAIGNPTPYLVINHEGDMVFYRRDGAERLRLTEEQVWRLVDTLTALAEKTL